MSDINTSANSTIPAGTEVKKASFKKKDIYDVGVSEFLVVDIDPDNNSNGYVRALVKGLGDICKRPHQAYLPVTVKEGDRLKLRVVSEDRILKIKMLPNLKKETAPVLFSKKETKTA